MRDSSFKIFEEMRDKEEYVIFVSGILVYTVARDASRLKWIARDTDGNQVDEPDCFRHDLFERLEIISKETHNNG